MVRLNISQSTCDNRVVEEALTYAGPQSLMLRMMLDASRRMVRTGYPQLDLDSMSVYMKRDLGFADCGNPHREQ
jgi:hypothetical protein